MKTSVLRCVGVIAALVLSGCTPLMQGAVDTMRLAFASPALLVVDRERVMQRPQYQLRIDSPYGSAIMVLGRVEGDTEYWVTSTRQVLVLKDGLIRRSVGFPENLEGTRVGRAQGQGEDIFATGLHRIASPLTGEREVDWMPGYRFGLRVTSTFKHIGNEDKEILGETRRLMRIDEAFQATNADFFGVNRYWVDPDDGFVFVTEQTLLPGLSLRLTQLRPYRGGAL